ncbi:hypothetical protein C8R44DRAFT_942223 [Mycena epipterygia]|nr:hypothetical protein C8R44DRAFT_942223 [Mycena epipterygia]
MNCGQCGGLAWAGRGADGDTHSTHPIPPRARGQDSERQHQRGEGSAGTSKRRALRRPCNERALQQARRAGPSGLGTQRRCDGGGCRRVWCKAVNRMVQGRELETSNCGYTQHGRARGAHGWGECAGARWGCIARTRGAAPALSPPAPQAPGTRVLLLLARARAFSCRPLFRVRSVTACVFAAHQPVTGSVDRGPRRPVDAGVGGQAVEIWRVQAQEGWQARVLRSTAGYRQRQTRAQMPPCADEGGRVEMDRGSIEYRIRAQLGRLRGRDEWRRGIRARLAEKERNDAELEEEGRSWADTRSKVYGGGKDRRGVGGEWKMIGRKMGRYFIALTMFSLGSIWPGDTHRKSFTHSESPLLFADAPSPSRIPYRRHGANLRADVHSLAVWFGVHGRDSSLFSRR